MAAITPDKKPPDAGPNIGPNATCIKIKSEPPAKTTNAPITAIIVHKMNAHNAPMLAPNIPPQKA